MKKIKICIVILAVFLVVALVIILSVIFRKKDELPQFQNISENNTIVSDDNETTSNLTVENVISNEIENNYLFDEDEKLKKEGNNRIYFIIKQCMKKYYTNYTYLVGEGTMNVKSDEPLEPVEDKLWYLIDDEAKASLNLDKNNLKEIHEDLEFPSFSIDQIYGQKLSSSQNIYVIYHRIEGLSAKEDRVITIKLDTKNHTFSVYPYEYVQQKNWANLKENDRVQIEKIQEIQLNEQNSYNTDEIEETELSYLQELYEKYRFDLYFDYEHLYSTLNEEYRLKNYESYEDFYNFIEENKKELNSDSIKKYRAVNIDKGKELIAVGKDGRNYVFDMVSFTEYTLRLDNYSTVTQEYLKAYNLVLAEGKGRYSINRIFNAINEKNYKFLYEKLNDAQKQNYYPTYEEFENFIKNTFSEENEAEVLESGQMIATNIYQYLVKVKDLTGKKSDTMYTISIFIEKDGEFKFGITNYK